MKRSVFTTSIAILFFLNWDNNYQINYLEKPALSNIEIISPATDKSVVWSPDGNKFVCYTPKVCTIYDINSRISKSVNIRVSSVEITWLNDLINIAYVEKVQRNKYRLILYDIEKDIGRTIFETNGILRNLRITDKGHIWIHERDKNNYYLFSREGEKLTDFYDEKVIIYDDDLNLVRINIDGTESEMIQTRGFRGDLSRDKRSIIYQYNGFLNIYSFDTKTKDQLVLGGDGKWSPDDKYIIYAVTKDDGHRILESDLFIMRNDGTNVTQLTSTSDLWEALPSFSPDGKKIAFTCYKTNSVYMADIDY